MSLLAVSPARASGKVIGRAWLRQALADTSLQVGGRPAWARTVVCLIDADGRLRQSCDRSLRHRYGLVVEESPAPLAATAAAAVAVACRQVAQALRLWQPADGYRLQLALAESDLHIEAVDAIEQPGWGADEHRLELRLVAHDAGLLQGWRGLGPSVAPSVCAGEAVVPGDELARVAITAASRPEAIMRARSCLQALRCDGVRSNRERLLAVLHDPSFRRGRLQPGLLTGPGAERRECLIVTAGLQTTVQDLPGRLGYWEVGVPPSGPMDDYGFRLANEAVGNPPGAAGLEITLGGFAARFPLPVTIACGGAPSPASVDGQAIEWLTPVTVPAGGLLRVPAPARGMRSYVAIRGGIDCGTYLQSAATFTLGGFGGWQGRALQDGDRLPLGEEAACFPAAAIAAERQPDFSDAWTVGLRVGPHGSPDFLTEPGLRQFLQSVWTVSPQSNRTGIRLLGPRPEWARRDGGEAGLHPSNLHDNAYAFGAIDLTGDTPVVLGPDGPSLGGFVCPGVVVAGQRWKLGQLRPGDRLRWQVVDAAGAEALRLEPQRAPPPAAIDSPVILRRAPRPEHPGRSLRRQGDCFLLIEFGAMELELGLRLRVQALYEELRRRCEPGIIDLVPGIRSLQVHFDPTRLSEARVGELLCRLDDALGSDHGDIVLPSREVLLPLSWDDPSTRKAIAIYQQTVNPTAPWCPWNIEFIRRINGLATVDEVQRIVFDASYLVYGLGDVYLGAPVATPVDPRHRLVTTKYNPARTWTPENAVGIGGAYLCVYGMEGPGGYQFVGRTVQVWNSYPQAACFASGRPWLLQQFDRLRFEPVTPAKLMELRRAFPAGRWQPRISEGRLSLAEQTAFARTHAVAIAAARERQQQAFAAERRRWQEAATCSV